MRWLLAMFKHETNTFSPVPTPVSRFYRSNASGVAGEAAIAAYRGTGTGLGGYLAVAERVGAEVVVATAAEAPPSGKLTDATYDQISRSILDAAGSGHFDAILLDLHGAMVTESFEDGEGTLLARLRELAPRTPIGVTLDMHANLYDEIVRHATVISGYHTYPHIDIRQAGERAANLIVDTLEGRIKPVMAWGNRPMLPHVMRQGTHSEPNRSLQAKCKAFEEGPALAASVFVGFPHADISKAGLSAVVCTDDDLALAERIRDELLGDAWRERERFVFRAEPLEKSIARARQIDDGPIVLLDHCDNTSSGGTMDTTVVLAEAIRQGLSNAAFYAIFDPQAVEQAIAAGIGANVTLSIGGKTPMPELTQRSHPIEVSGKVKLIFDGCFRNRGPMLAGVLMDLGPTVVLDTGKIEIVLISRHQEPYDLNTLTSVGIDPWQKQYLILKSRVHWRAGFGDLAKHVIECDGLGVTTSDYSKLTFRHVRRPIYPLDVDVPVTSTTR